MTKKGKEDEQISTGLSYAHPRLQAKCQQTSNQEPLQVMYSLV